MTMIKHLLACVGLLITTPFIGAGDCYSGASYVSYPSYSYSYPSYTYSQPTYTYQQPVQVVEKKVYVAQYVPLVVGVPVYGASYSPQALSTPNNFQQTQQPQQQQTSQSVQAPQPSPCDTKIKEYQEQLLKCQSQLLQMNSRFTDLESRMQSHQSYQQQQVLAPSYQQQYQQPQQAPAPSYQQPQAPAPQYQQPQAPAPQPQYQPKKGLANLVQNKCMQCHDASNAQKEGGSFVMTQNNTLRQFTREEKNNIMQQLWSHKMPRKIQMDNNERLVFSQELQQLP